MITNKGLRELYNNINNTKEVKAAKLKEIYDAIVVDDYSNIMNEMAERFNVSVYEWRIYRAISIRVINNQMTFEGLS